MTRFARLTHEQYSNTVRDLFGIEERAGDAFAPDALNGFAFSNSVDFIVDGRLAPQYRDAAEAMAERVVSEAAVFGRLVPCEEPVAQCRDQFVAEFGLHAFRRPLTTDERDGFTELFDQGSDLVASGNDFRDGIQLVVEAMLQSPQFLYRTELSDGSPIDGRIALDGYEIASRLSYFLYNSMPDDALLQAAAQGDLLTVDGVQAQVTRMLTSSRALDQLVQFHEQAWQFGRYSKIAPDRDLYPNAPDDLAQRALEASQLYVRDVLDSGGGAYELLTEPFVYADSALAPLYGQQVDGDFERLDVNSSERRGLLTQVGFLASHAYTRKSDPIHRGLFVIRDLLCRGVGEPPPGASMTKLPADAPTPKTTREEIALLTAAPECAACHNVINPPGFAFEGFDAVGQTRTDENGNPVDTSGTMVLDGAQVEFSGATELIESLASSQEMQRCYAGKWMQFAYGRSLSTAELALVDDLSNRPSVTQLVTTIATEPHFLTRPPTQVAQ